MKHSKLLALIALMLIGVYFASCGKEKETEMSKMIPADRIVLNGENSELFQVADSAKVVLVPSGKQNAWEIRATIKIQNTKPWTMVKKQSKKPIESISVYSYKGTKYIDKNDTELDFSIENLSSEPFNKVLKSDNTITETVVCNDNSWSSEKNYKRQKAVFERIDGIVINGISLKYEENTSSTSSSSYNSSSTKSSSKNWNKVLDEYEKFVDQYIKTYKKAMNGDMSAMGEYARLLEKAEDLEDDLADAEDELTTAQMNRYMKITEKLSNALLY